MCEHVCGGCGDAAQEAGGSAGLGTHGEAVAGAVDRRELLKRGGLAAAALLLAACGVGTGDAITGPSGGTLNLKLSDYPALANSGGTALVSGVAVENNNGSYLALSLTCPHQGGQILQNGSGFQCRVHGATFDHTGRWIGGQPTSHMFQLSVKDNGDGTLTIS